MRNAIGMVELTSIARGIETCDYMVKAAQVDLIRSSTVCPGKYIILIAGDTGDVKASMAEGIRQGGEYVVNTLLLPNVHPRLRPPGPLFQSYQALGNMPSQIHSCSVRDGVCAARSQYQIRGWSATCSTAAAKASQADLQADWLPVSRAPPKLVSEGGA